MLERGLRAAGYRTGRYTSPHLVDLEERFAIDGVAIGPAQLDAAAERILAIASALPWPPSFFEATTAMALDLFRSAPVDVAVLEVGLGGRLDATNIVTPAGVAITAVDFDHEEYLGHTLEAIAAEKAGVIKAGSTVVLGRNPRPVEGVVANVCAAVGARFVRSQDGVRCSAEMIDGRARIALETPRHRYDPMSLALRGRHQVDNALTAVRLLEELSAAGPVTVDDRAIRVAVTDVAWPARLDLVRIRGIDVLIDGAHNPSGARALAEHVRSTYGRPLPMVIGIMRDKNIDAIVAALATAASHFVCTAAASPRATAVADLVAAVRRAAPHLPVTSASTPAGAVGAAAAFGTPVVAAGSLYLAGEIRAGRT
jgi:dihydrofolate synthase / folylpolyglutamate synthase